MPVAAPVASGSKIVRFHIQDAKTPLVPPRPLKAHQLARNGRINAIDNKLDVSIMFQELSQEDNRETRDDMFQGHYYVGHASSADAEAALAVLAIALSDWAEDDDSDEDDVYLRDNDGDGDDDDEDAHFHGDGSDEGDSSDEDAAQFCLSCAYCSEYRSYTLQGVGAADGWSNLPFHNVGDDLEVGEETEEPANDEVENRRRFISEHGRRGENLQDWKRRWLSEYRSHVWYWWWYYTYGNEFHDDAFGGTDDSNLTSDDGEEDFEDTAFPHFKPDYGLYDTPQRVKRGRPRWYHIHRRKQLCWLCSPATLIASTAPTHTHQEVLHLPSEIIHKIAQMCLGWFENSFTSPRRPTTPALVCRHWAEVCLRDPVWSQRYTDMLYGRDDLLALRALVSSPGSYLKVSVTHFDDMEYCLSKDSDQTPSTGAQERGDQPWLHLLPSTRRILTNYNTGTSKEGNILIVGPLCKGLKTMRSIHAYLPRSLPTSFSHGIRSLSFCAIQFRQFADLQHVLSEVPSLERFHGSDLSWLPGVPPTAGFPRRGGRDVQHKEVRLLGCTADLEATTLLALLQHNRSWYSAIRAVAESLASGSTRAEASCVDVRIAPESVMHWRYHKGELEQHPNNILCDIDSRIYEYSLETRKLVYEVRALLPLTTLPDLPYSRGPKPFIRILTHSSVNSVDWKAFDEAVTAHSIHPRVVEFSRSRPPNLRYSAQEYDEWKPLTEDDKQFIIERLPLLSAAGSISVVTNSA